MANTLTKVVAGLGIVAGLGVAALPLSSYAANVTVSVVVDEVDDTTGATGGNNAGGYTWTTTDADGTKFNMAIASDLAGDNEDRDGATTGGLAPIGSAAATVTGTNVYGIQYTARPDDLPALSLTVTTTNYLPVTGSTQEIASSDAAGKIKAWAASTTENSDVRLGESHNNSLPNGTYYNTVTIAQTSN